MCVLSGPVSLLTKFLYKHNTDSYGATMGFKDICMGMKNLEPLRGRVLT